MDSVDLVVSLAVISGWLLVGRQLIRRYSRDEAGLMWASLAAHLASAVVAIIVYKVVYGSGDMFAYHGAGRILADGIRRDPSRVLPPLIEVIFHREVPIPVPITLYSGSTAAMQAISGLVLVPTANSLYGAALLIAGFSFLAKVQIYRLFRFALPAEPVRPLLYCSLLVPSVVFWSSTLLKESIAMIGLGLLCAGAERLARSHGNPAWAPYLLSGVLVTATVKGFWAPPFGLAIAAWLLLRTASAQGGKLRIRPGLVVLGVVLAVAFVLGTAALVPRFDPATVLDAAELTRRAAAGSLGGSNYSLGEEEGSTTLGILPLAVLTVLTRPAIIEARSPVQIANALEMLVFTWLLLLVIVRRGLLGAVRLVFRNPFLAFAASYAAGIAIGVGLSTVNLGTLSRYRIPMMPFYALVLVLASRRASPSPARPQAMP